MREIIGLNGMRLKDFRGPLILRSISMKKAMSLSMMKAAKPNHVQRSRIVIVVSVGSLSAKDAWLSNYTTGADSRLKNSPS